MYIYRCICLKVICNSLTYLNYTRYINILFVLEVTFAVGILTEYTIHNESIISGANTISMSVPPQADITLANRTHNASKYTITAIVLVTQDSRINQYYIIGICCTYLSHNLCLNSIYFG